MLTVVKISIFFEMRKVITVQLLLTLCVSLLLVFCDDDVGSQNRTSMRRQSRSATRYNPCSNDNANIMVNGKSWKNHEICTYQNVNECLPGKCYTVRMRRCIGIQKFFREIFGHKSSSEDDSTITERFVG